jgi:hypothetical protein
VFRYWELGNWTWTRLTKILEFHRHLNTVIILVYGCNALPFLVTSRTFVLTVPRRARIGVAENLVERFEII